MIMSEMKAFSIMQPWAWLIVNGHKDIENRKWATNYRGPILIHAGKLILGGGLLRVFSYVSLSHASKDATSSHGILSPNIGDSGWENPLLPAMDVMFSHQQAFEIPRKSDANHLLCITSSENSSL